MFQVLSWRIIEARTKLTKQYYDLSEQLHWHLLIMLTLYCRSTFIELEGQPVGREALDMPCWSFDLKNWGSSDTLNMQRFLSMSLNLHGVKFRTSKHRYNYKERGQCRKSVVDTVHSRLIDLFSLSVVHTC